MEYIKFIFTLYTTPVSCLTVRFSYFIFHYYNRFVRLAHTMYIIYRKGTTGFIDKVSYSSNLYTIKCSISLCVSDTEAKSS
jgi:hypothetical protein